MAASYGTLSDIRLKENIKPVRGYLNDMNRLRVVKYNLKANGESNIGLIAQEVETVFPGVVETGAGNENLKSIKYSVLNVMMIKSIQELTEKLKEEIENRIKLEQKVSTLEALMTTDQLSNVSIKN